MSEQSPELPAYVDPHLWFEDGGQRLYLVADNPHTFHGRMCAYHPALDLIVMVSKSDVVNNCSEEARYFVLGYLSGNQPDPPRNAEGDWVEDDDPRSEEWRRAVTLFHETGYWNTEHGRMCGWCGAELLLSDPGEPCVQCVDSPTP